MIKAFYLMNESGISLLSKEFSDVKVDQQLFGGMLSALDMFSSEVTGSNIKSFTSQNALVNIQMLQRKYKFVALTSLDMPSEAVSVLFNEMNEYLISIDFFSKYGERFHVFESEEQLTIDLMKLLDNFNAEYLTKSTQKELVQKKGQVKVIFNIFKDDVIRLWENLLIGKRFIITGSNEQRNTDILNSLLLLHPDDRIYYILSNIETKDMTNLENYSHFIATTLSSFILMMRKDLWDVHIDADRHIINVQATQNPIEKFEIELFEEFFSLAELEETEEKNLRKIIDNINSKILNMRDIIKSDDSKLLKKFKISKTFYDNIISQIKLPDT